MLVDIQKPDVSVYFFITTKSYYASPHRLATMTSTSACTTNYNFINESEWASSAQWRWLSMSKSTFMCGALPVLQKNSKLYLDSTVSLQSVSRYFTSSRSRKRSYKPIAPTERKHWGNNGKKKLAFRRKPPDAATRWPILGADSTGGDLGGWSLQFYFLRL